MAHDDDKQRNPDLYKNVEMVGKKGMDAPGYLDRQSQARDSLMNFAIQDPKHSEYEDFPAAQSAISREYGRGRAMDVLDSPEMWEMTAEPEWKRLGYGSLREYMRDWARGQAMEVTDPLADFYLDQDILGMYAHQRLMEPSDPDKPMRPAMPATQRPSGDYSDWMRARTFAPSGPPLSTK